LKVVSGTDCSQFSNPNIGLLLSTTHKKHGFHQEYRSISTRYGCSSLFGQHVVARKSIMS
jgi:hypothetical protein